MIKRFTDDAWDDYMYWLSQDRKTIRRINAIIRDIERDPFFGIGKPEPLKHELSGKWSRRIDAMNRVIYSVDDNGITVYSCRDHY